MTDTKIPLYSRISINRDFPEYHLRRGDIATFIDTVPHPEGNEEGYILEVFNAVGESIDVVTVPKSAVEALRSDEIPRVRSLNETKPRSRRKKGKFQIGYMVRGYPQGRGMRVSRRIGRKSSQKPRP